MALDRDFEKFTGGPTTATRERMHITLSALGVFYLNQNAYRLMGNPAAVWFHYSRERDTIAIEPASPRMDDTFPVKAMQGCGWRILGGPFVGSVGIRTDHTIKFTHPEIENDILLLSLRHTINVTPRRYKEKK